MNTWIQLIIPGALLVVFLVYHFARAPYEIYKEQFEKHEDEIEIKEARNAELAIEIDILTGKLAEKSEADKLVIARAAAKEALGYHSSQNYNNPKKFNQRYCG
jgi:hypothetical protein